jgi:hypothetical protein
MGQKTSHPAVRYPFLTPGEKPALLQLFEMYCDGKTEILTENKNGKFPIQVLQIM